MWTVLETREAAKALDKAPADVVRKFQAWTAIVQQSGAQGLRRCEASTMRLWRVRGRGFARAA